MVTGPPKNCRQCRLHVHVALGVLCCFALFVCLTLLASFFHLSFSIYNYIGLMPGLWSRGTVVVFLLNIFTTVLPVPMLKCMLYLWVAINQPASEHNLLDTERHKVRSYIHVRTQPVEHREAQSKIIHTRPNTTCWIQRGTK